MVAEACAVVASCSTQRTKPFVVNFLYSSTISNILFISFLSFSLHILSLFRFIFLLSIENNCRAVNVYVNCIDYKNLSPQKFTFISNFTFRIENFIGHLKL